MVPDSKKNPNWRVTLEEPTKKRTGFSGPPRKTGGISGLIMFGCGLLTAFCLGAVVLCVGLLMTRSSEKIEPPAKSVVLERPTDDTRLLEKKAQTVTYTNSFNTYYGDEKNPKIERPAETAVTDADSVAVNQPVIVQTPEPRPIEDLTVVIVRPERRKPEQRIVVIDERVERLRREHLARIYQESIRPGSLAGQD